MWRFDMIEIDLQFFGGRGGASTSGATVAAEQGIYNLPSRASAKAVTQALKDAPAGTTLAYQNAGRTMVLEKSSTQDAFNNNMWLKTTIDENGNMSATREGVGSIADTVKFANSSDRFTKGFESNAQRNSYKSGSKALKNEFRLE